VENTWQVFLNIEFLITAYMIIESILAKFASQLKTISLLKMTKNNLLRFF